MPGIQFPYYMFLVRYGLVDKVFFMMLDSLSTSQVDKRIIAFI